MNREEKNSIDRLCEIARDLKHENNLFKEKITELTEKLNSKVEAKHAPLNFESNILHVLQSSMNEAIKKSLEGYNSPLNSLILSVINSHSTEIREIIDSSFKEVLNLEDFKKSIVSAFSHKIAKTIISNNDGLFDKVSNDLKQDSVFKSRMILAVTNVVEECLKNK